MRVSENFIDNLWYLLAALTSHQGAFLDEHAVEIRDALIKALELSELEPNEPEKEIDVTVTPKVVETLPWIDYQEVLKEIKARGMLEGIAEVNEEAASMISTLKQSENNYSYSFIFQVIQIIFDLNLDLDIDLKGLF